MRNNLYKFSNRFLTFETKNVYIMFGDGVAGNPNRVYLDEAIAELDGRLNKVRSDWFQYEMVLPKEYLH